MTPGHKYFIENYLKIVQPDGTLKSMTLRQCDLEFIEAVEKAEKSGAKLQLLKGKRRYRFALRQ